MALSGKLEYTQADGALTEAFQEVTFSVDGTVRTYPNAIEVVNDEASGSTKVVKVAINAGEQVCATLTAGQKVRYSIKKVKQLKLARSATGAPSYTARGVL